MLRLLVRVRTANKRAGGESLRRKFLKSEPLIYLKIEAAARGVIDYSTYDGSSEWTKREKYILWSIRNSIDREVAKETLETSRALFSSGRKFNDDNEMLSRLRSETIEIVRSLQPWMKLPEDQTTISDEFKSTADKLIERYHEVFGTKNKAVDSE